MKIIVGYSFFSNFYTHKHYKITIQYFTPDLLVQGSPYYAILGYSGLIHKQFYLTQNLEN